MLITASTVKDSPENTAFFVTANLASGVDHMFVFLDDPDAPEQREVAEDLGQRAHVTCIRADAEWWRGDRPQRLNVRQRINVNAVVALLEPFAWAQWVFHVDGDEVVRADTAALALVPPAIGAVRLTTKEAVSQSQPTARPTLFKRPLDEGELHLLTILGVIDRPSIQSYFHGHVLGKSGVRPSSGLRLTLHDAVRPSGVRVPPGETHTAPDLDVLHYDAVSGEEFVRKWRSMVAAGPVSLRPDRAPLAMALRSLVTGPVSQEVAEEYLRRIYERTTRDDVTTLSELGLLEEVDPLRGGHVPASIPVDAGDALANRLVELHNSPKRQFHVNHVDRRAMQDEDRPGRLTALRRRLRR